MTTAKMPVDRRATVFMYVGLALTAIATLAPVLDMVTVDTVTDHVRNAYPNWPDDLVAADRNAIVGYLAVVGVLGIAGWLLAIAGVRRHARWARAVSTIMFVLGAIIALTDLTLGGAEYSVIVPTLHGTLGMLPTVAGLAAIVLLWRAKRPTP
ncbi:hypothetical protein [Amycolatopsis taiwanensis]|uniref:Uncharacterized protein n=1 Tax=Amycolatopsis taiwanensis TaxID=342230 RepID=A0A9W6VK46_9PSEU|nr:hypothetical protein [Amycolatopsis taiwanensis]GLY70087.1 hypothetical protein Atai01_67060 [Amycolatopsis taiwanensis]